MRLSLSKGKRADIDLPPSNDEPNRKHRSCCEVQLWSFRSLSCRCFCVSGIMRAYSRRSASDKRGEMRFRGSGALAILERPPKQKKKKKKKQRPSLASLCYSIVASLQLLYVAPLPFHARPGETPRRSGAPPLGRRSRSRCCLAAACWTRRRHEEGGATTTTSSSSSRGCSTSCFCASPRARWQARRAASASTP